MNFKTAKEYIEYLDEQSGESWSNSTEELADVMEDYAKIYHERQLKLLSIADVAGRSEQFFCNNKRMGVRCVKQCLGCFQFQNKD